MINTVVLVGRLTRDPELRKAGSGTSVCNFTVAVDRRVQNGQSQADFISCTAFGRTAETMCQYLRKGALIGVEGRIQTSSYDNQQGQRVYRTDVIANSVQFLEPRGARNSSGFDNAQAPADDFTRSSGWQNNSYQQPAYHSQPQQTYRSYSSSQPQQNSAYGNSQSSSFGGTQSNDFDDAFDNSDRLDIATDDLPF